jgi:hypothetical protein
MCSLRPGNFLNFLEDGFFPFQTEFLLTFLPASGTIPVPHLISIVPPSVSALAGW